MDDAIIGLIKGSVYCKKRNQHQQNATEFHSFNRRICSAIGGMPPAVKRGAYYEMLADAAA